MMKKILAITAALILVTSGAAYAVIAGSSHDMTTYTGDTMSSCQYCHTPHHAVVGAGTAPLWNRSLPSASYTVYGGGSTLSGTTVNQPGVNSKTCLSCHDGTVALGDVAVGTDDTLSGTTPDGYTLAAGGFLQGGIDYFGTNLTREHPVGVAYDTAVTSAGLNSSVVFNGAGTVGVVASKWRIYGSAIGTARVECGSCHDPHNTTAGQTPFLRNTKSTMCSDCHSAK